MSFEKELDRFYKLTPEEDAQRDALYLKNRELIHACLGLAGEAGEVVDLVKKHVNYGKGLDLEKLVEECGDTIHYLARVLGFFGFSLADAQVNNLEKLRKRFPDGYSNENAIERKDEQI